MATKSPPLHGIVEEESESFTTVKSRIRKETLLQNLARMAEASSSSQDRRELTTSIRLAEHGVTTQKLEATINALISMDGYSSDSQSGQLVKQLTTRLQEQQVLEKNPFARALAARANRSRHLVPLTQNATPVPTFTQNSQQPQIITLTGPEDRLADTSAFLLPASPTPEQVSSFQSYIQNPQAHHSWALDQVARTSGQAGKRIAVKGLKKLAGKATAKTAARLGLKAAAGVATGGAGAAAIEGASLLRKYGKKAAEVAAAALALFFIRTILPLLQAIGAITSFLAGAASVFAITGSAPLSLAGGAGGYALHSAIQSSGGYTALASRTAAKASQVGSVLTTATATPGLALFSVLGAFGSVVFITWFGMSHMLAAFTVPFPNNPQSYYPQPPDQLTPAPGITPAPPVATDLESILREASNLTCIPEALLKAVIQREASGALGFTDAQVSYFANDEWWKSAATSPYSPPPLPNCYDSSIFYSHSAGACSTGYCYDTCSTVGCSDPSFDVAGATQFRRQTFYGGGCRDPQGIQDGCQGGVIPAIAPYITDHSIPNRCNLRDAILAQAFFIKKNIGIENLCPSHSFWTSGNICASARMYCGSCGQVEQYQDRIVNGQAIKEYYPCGKTGVDAYLQPGDNGYGSTGCGRFNPNNFDPNAPEATAGYCDSIYYNYQQYL
jgi:hypothetical protein